MSLDEVCGDFCDWYDEDRMKDDKRLLYQIANLRYDVEKYVKHRWSNAEVLDALLRAINATVTDQSVLASVVAAWWRMYHADEYLCGKTYEEDVNHEVRVKETKYIDDTYRENAHL